MITFLRFAPWVAIILAVGLLLYMVRENGKTTALQNIERQNNDASTRANETVLDYDACLDAGRLWNFGTGKCVRRAGRDRD